MQDSMVQSAKANITRELRGELQQISFGTNGALTALGNKPYFYDQDGKFLANNNTAPTGSYYKVTYQVSAASFVDSSQTAFSFALTNARNIKGTMVYPVSAPAANQKTLIFSLFAANQKSY